MILSRSRSLTIKLTNDLETSLVINIAEGLQNTIPKKDFLTPSDFSWAAAIEGKLPADAQSKLDRYIGERALGQFILAEITRDNYSHPIIERIVAGRAITSLGILSNPIAYSRALVTKLKSLPIRYRLTAALPSLFTRPIISQIEGIIELPQSIVIAKGASLPSPLPTSSPIPYYNKKLFNDWVEGGTEERDIEDDRVYLSMPTLGYSNGLLGASLARSFEDTMRAFYGAGIAIGMLNFGWESSPDERSYIMIHDEQTRELIQTHKIEEDLVENSYWYCSTTSFAKTNSLDLSNSIGRAIRRIGTIFQTDVDALRLFSACVWFQKAKVNSRPLDAMLQATIAIEVLLGDRKAAEGIGLTNLLSSRCAYLLGRSTAHRQQIEANFRKVYDLRSQIVHEGRHVVKTDDQSTLKIALSLCASIITKELAIRAEVTSPKIPF